MATLPTPTAASVDANAHDRAARRLQAWASRHPDAAALAALASLAVRIDSTLLRRLRLQLLPRAEPGTEADVWFSGLHESRGRDGVVLDAGVQRLLRARLARQPAGDGGVRPLDAAWRITAALHADAPEAIRTEEALTWEALRGRDDLPERIDTLLAPALAAMAGGGEARALEVARWAQRAVPRLPDAARQHPSALALWLAALMRLGLPASRLPDTGEAGLPPALQWLLPKGQTEVSQRVAVTPFDDALVLRSLADDAPPAANEISLPRTRPLLLAVRVDGGDPAGLPLLQRTVALEATASETRLPLPDGWRALELHSLSGERWLLQRQAGEVPTDDAPLPWQRMRALVLGGNGEAVGMAVFVSQTELVTVVDTVPPALLKALRERGEWSPDAPTVGLHAWDAAGQRQTVQAQAAALDPRSSLVVLVLQRPFIDAMAVDLSPMPMVGPEGWLWTVPGLHATQGHLVAPVVPPDAEGPPGPARLPEGRLLPRHRHFGLRPPMPPSDVAGMAGAPVFAEHRLAGIADLPTVDSSGETGSILWAVPAVALVELLAWVRQPRSEAPRVLLHHAVDDPHGKGAEIDERAVQRIEHAALRARLQLVRGDAGAGARAVIDDPQAASFAPDLAAAVRLVTPVTREDSSPAARLRLLALAARRWANPAFGLVQFRFRQTGERQRLPPPLAGPPLLDIETFDDDTLVRVLLDVADPTPPLPTNWPLADSSRSFLRHSLDELARPFARSDRDLDSLVALVDRLSPAHDVSLADMADLIVPRWTRSSRLDGVPLVETLAQLALPVPDEGLLEALRDAERGALVLNAMPVQFGRLLLSRAHADWLPPSIVVRNQTWEGAASVDAIEAQVIRTVATALDCAPDDVRTLLKRLDLPLWILVATRPLPDKQLLLQLELRLPSARWLFLAGPEPDLAKTASAIGAQLLPLLPERADMVWLQGYKQLMQWARPRRKTIRASFTAPWKGKG